MSKWIMVAYGVWQFDSWLCVKDSSGFWDILQKNQYITTLNTLHDCQNYIRQIKD